MTPLDEIRKKVQRQYRINPNVHICYSLNRPKIRIENQEATIKGVYPNIFTIESRGKSYTFQYADILTNNFSITEIGKT